MARRWFKPSFMLLIPLALVLVMALACGTDDPTPQPTPTPVDITAIVQQALAGQSAGVTSADVAKAVQDALAAQPGVTAGQVATEIANALAAKPGVTDVEVAAAIENALKAQPGISPEDIEKAVQEAVVKALPTAAPTTVRMAMPSDLFIREGKRGGVIPMHLGNNPAHLFIWECVSDVSCASQAIPMYNRLLEYNMETLDFFDIRGDLARSWEASPDNQTYTFKLHDANWWDGKPVTAHDVVFAFDSWVDPDEPRGRNRQISKYYEAGNARAIDDKTVEVNTKIPTGAILSLMANQQFSIYPKHHLEAIAPKRPKLVEDQLGSGPFKLVKHTRDVSLEYERNDDYFKAPRPYYDGMKWFILRGANTVIAAWQTEQILDMSSSVAGISVEQKVQLAKDMGHRMSIFDAAVGAFRFIEFNTKKKPFDDARVRRAMNLAINHQEYGKILKHTILGAFFPPDTPFYLTSEEQAKLPGYRLSADGETHPDDLAEAKRLLTEAGVPEGFQMSIDGAQVGNFDQMATVIADQLNRYLGFDVKINVKNYVAAQDDWRRGDYDTFSFGSSYLVGDPDFYIGANYLPGGERNRSNWEDQRIIDLSEKIAAETDPAKRKELVLEAARILEEEVPLIPLAWSSGNHISNNRIKNFHPTLVSSASTYHEHKWLEDNYIIIGER